MISETGASAPRGVYRGAIALMAGAALAAGGTAQEVPAVGAGGAPLEPILRPIGAAEVSVTEFDTVDIVAQNAYLTDILQKLAIQSRRNIVPSGGAERLVTANIYGARFDDALKALLGPNDLGFVEEGDFVYIYTAEQLRALNAAGFGTVTRRIPLDYLRPEDARAFVTSMLSEVGVIEVTRDLTGGEGGGGGGEQGANTLGGPVTDDQFYSPDQDEFALDNALIVSDRPENIGRIEAFIEEIDLRPPQILIEASIIQTSINEMTGFGVDFALLGNENFVDFFTAPVTAPIGFQVDADGNSIPPGDDDGFVIGSAGNVGAGAATIKAGYVGDVGVFLRALDQVTDVTLLSNPKLLTLNRQRSKVFVGERVGFLESTSDEGQIIQTLDTIDTGIILDIRPFVMKDGQIRLELSPKVSDVEFRDLTGAGGFTQQIPDEIIQTVTTDILIPGGHTAVIGGLFREDTQRSRSQVPLLGDLPLIGWAFQGRDDSITKSEIIFLIKPT
ncbi:MAG: hypothetical protein AAFY46_05840, partial [Planctomycetota bacterium]